MVKDLVPIVLFFLFLSLIRASFTFFGTTLFMLTIPISDFKGNQKPRIKTRSRKLV
uniref:Uncharacterized protein n=1 Tax=Anguilla anguilla TaxID=7936 RepID=A0A0E9PXR7_ANGAN